MEVVSNDILQDIHSAYAAEESNLNNLQSQCSKLREDDLLLHQEYSKLSNPSAAEQQMMKKEELDMCDLQLNSLEAEIQNEETKLTQLNVLASRCQSNTAVLQSIKAQMLGDFPLATNTDMSSHIANVEQEIASCEHSIHC